MRILLAVIVAVAGAWWLLDGPSDEPLAAERLPTRDLDPYRRAPTATSHPRHGKPRCLVVQGL